VLRDVQKISLVIGDSPLIRTKLQEQQLLCYGQTRAIPAHCPTRWGILGLIAKSILDNKVRPDLVRYLKS
jgi:hypothetical protein